jgi:Kef-type K+ transport system membrane component KefB
MRRDIFGLGLSQLIVTGAVLTALVAGLGLALSSTAFALQILEERGTLNRPYGNRTFAVLLLHDLAIAPLLALVALLGPAAAGEGGNPWLEAGRIIGVVAAVVIVGRHLLRPVFASSR